VSVTLASDAMIMFILQNDWDRSCCFGKQQAVHLHKVSLDSVVLLQHSTMNSPSRAFLWKADVSLPSLVAEVHGQELQSGGRL
jgi:hypothetical protein